MQYLGESSTTFWQRMAPAAVACWFTTALLLSACSSPAPRPEPVADPVVEPAEPITIDPTRVVEESRLSGPSLEVAPLENPAVALLVAEADSRRESADLDAAGGLLERALRLEPENPRLWQRLAEIRLEQGRYLEAEEMAMRSLGHSAQVGEWCRRNWLTLRETRSALGDPAEAERAAEQAAACARPPPPRY
jgi:tetratricopeptide (TPR) repeat protein